MTAFYDFRTGESMTRWRSLDRRLLQEWGGRDGLKPLRVSFRNIPATSLKKERLCVKGEEPLPLSSAWAILRQIE